MMRTRHDTVCSRHCKTIWIAPDGQPWHVFNGARCDSQQFRVTVTCEREQVIAWTGTDPVHSWLRWMWWRRQAGA